MTRPSPASGIIVWWVFIFALVIILHLPSWPGEFAYDEFRTVVYNPCTTGETSVSALLSSDLWCLQGAKATASYRPLPALWARAVYSIAGPDVVIYRLANLFVYSLIIGLLGIFLLRLGIPKGWMIAGVALFTVMGAHVESTLSAAAVSDELFSLFALTLLLWSVSERRWESGCMAVGWGLFTLALLSKESALALIPAVIIVDVVKKQHVSVRRRMALYLAFAVTVAGYLLLRFCLFGHLGVIVGPQDNPLAGAEGFAVIWGAFAALGKGVIVMLVPGLWTLDHAQCTIHNGYAVAGIVWATASCLILYRAFKRRDIALAMVAVLYWTGVGVSSNLLVLSPSLLAERQLLLASAGMVLLVLLAGGYIYSRWHSLRRVVTVFFILFIVLQAAATMMRASDWSSEEGLYRSAVMTCPESLKMQVNLAHWLRTHGSCLEADVMLGRILKSVPAQERFYLFREQGYARHLCANYQGAIEAYTRALTIRPDAFLKKLITSARNREIPSKTLENTPYR